MLANLVEDPGKCLLSETNLKLLSLHLRSDESIFINIGNTFIIVVIRILEAHDSDLSGLALETGELLTLAAQESIGALAELQDCQDHDDQLEDHSLDGENDELVAPVHVHQDDDVGDEDKAVAEDEAEVSSQSLQVEELARSAESRHRRLKTVEAAIEHFAELEVEQ